MNKSKKKAMKQKKGNKPLPPIPVKSERVKAPAAQSRRITGLGQPKVRPVGSAGDVCVIHKEYISDLLASATAGAFGVLGIPINPGNLLMFPWLSKLAENFESYVFKGLKFIFETDAPSTTPGTVLMAVDYDAEDVLPSGKGEMMSYRGACRTVPWARLEMGCDREDLHKRKSYFIRDLAEDWSETAGELSRQQVDDPRLDDVGTFIIGASNCLANDSLGELYVEYEVELQTPKGGSEGENAWHILASGTGCGITAAKPFGDEFFPVAGDSNSAQRAYVGLPIKYLISGGTTSAIQFYSPNKTYMVLASLVGNNPLTVFTGSTVTSSSMTKHIGNDLTTGNTGSSWAVVTTSSSRDPTYDFGRLTFSASTLTAQAASDNNLWVTPLPDWTAVPFKRTMPLGSVWCRGNSRRGHPRPDFAWSHAYPSDASVLSSSEDCSNSLAEGGSEETNGKPGEKEQIAPTSRASLRSSATVQRRTPSTFREVSFPKALQLK